MRKILFFLFALPLVVLADGDCHLVQQSDGSWQIVCSGTGIQIQYETVTQEVYIVENCEELKSEFSALSRNLSVGVSSMNSQMASLSSAIGAYGYPDSLWIPYQNAVEYISPTPSSGYEDTNLYNISRDLDVLINDFQCGSCPTNGTTGGGLGGSCCSDVDFTPILQAINLEIQAINAVSNILSDIRLSIDSGFGTTTNALNSGFGSTTNAIYDLSYELTNLIQRIVTAYAYTRSTYSLPNSAVYSHWLQTSSVSGTPTISNQSIIQNTILKKYANMSNAPYNNGYLAADWAANMLSYFALNSLNTYFWDLREVSLPVITNTLVRFESNVTNDLATLVAVAKMVSDLTEIAATDYATVSQRLASASSNRVTNWFERVELLLEGILWKDQLTADLQQDEREELEQQLGTSSLQGQRLEIEGAFKPADLISFDYNLSERELNLPQFGDNLPQYLFIEFSANQASGIEDADATSIKIDLTNSNVIGFISFIRSMFRLLWWGLLSYLIWWLFGLFLRGLEWLRGIIVGIKF